MLRKAAVYSNNFESSETVHLSKLLGEKVQVDSDQEKAQSERNSHSKNRSKKKKTKLTIRYEY